MNDIASDLPEILWAFVLGILLVAGLAATRLTKKLKFPNVTGFLVVGIFIALISIGIDFLIGHGVMPGENGEGVVTKELNLLNEIVGSVALGFIALSIGEEFKIKRLKEYGSKVFVVTLFQSLLAGFLVGGFVLLACWLMHVELYVALLLGAVATATAPAATLMVIQQYNAKGQLVDLLLPIVAFDDAIGLVAFSVAVSVSKVMATGAAIDWIALVVLPLINIVGSLALGFILGLFLKLTIRFFRSRHNHLMMLIAFTLLGTGACAIINYPAVINGEKLEFSSLLTCMMIGATYINIGRDIYTIKRDFHLVGRWSPFLLLLFFVLAGSHLVTSAFSLFSKESQAIGNVLLPTLLIFAIYLVARTIGKYFGAFFGCLATKQRKTNTYYLGITLLPQAGVAIGMANSISMNEAFNGPGNSTGNLVVTVVLCATLIYELIGPLLTKIALTKSGDINLAQEERPFGEYMPSPVEKNLPAANGNAVSHYNGSPDRPFAGNPNFLQQGTEPSEKSGGSSSDKPQEPGKDCSSDSDAGNASVPGGEKPEN